MSLPLNQTEHNLVEPQSKPLALKEKFSKDSNHLNKM